MHSSLLRFVVCSLLLTGSLLPAQAQVISSEQVFPVEGYSVFERGYPLKVAPGGAGKFIFIEWWAEGKQGRRDANHYLQKYGTRDYAEYWFKPLTNAGFERMAVSDLIKLEHVYVVVGKQYRPDLDKQVFTVARFFDLDGKPLDFKPALLSTFPKHNKKYKEWVTDSPQRKTLLWLGVAGNDCYMTLWGDYGGNRWEKNAEIPFSKERYEVDQVKVNDKGEVYLLLANKRTPTAPLILAKFLPEEEQFQTVLVNRDPALSLGMVKMALTPDGEIVLMGTYASPNVIGLSNGAKLVKPNLQNYAYLFYQRFSENKGEWTAAVDSVYQIPEQWLSFFAETGSNFSDIQVFCTKNKVSMVLEEQYADRKKSYYYNLGVAGVDMKTGQFLWSDLVEKKQRDQGSAHFMSYVPGVVGDRLRLVYLTERGARGKLMCTSLDMETGKRRDKLLASNETAEYLVFPSRSGMVSGHEMVLVSMGNPSQNNYKLITITF
jgi:hypothetical protein